CSNVCPVKINIHDQLYKWRQVIVKEGYAPKSKAVAMKAMAETMASPSLFRVAGKAGRWFLRNVPFAINNRLNPWYKERDMPEAPRQSFAEWHRKNIANKSKYPVMTSRERILADVLKNQPSAVPLPDLGVFKGATSNPVREYMDTFTGIGGKAVVVSDVQSVESLLREQFDLSRRVVTTVPAL